MKKLTAILIISSMLLTFASCADNNDPSDSDRSQPSSEAETTTVTEEKTESEKETEPEEETKPKDDNDDKNSEVIDINNYITVDTPEPALWKATDPETGNELYLMGTIHVLSEEKFSMPDYLLDVYENSDGIAVEYDIRELEEISGAQELLLKMIYSDGSTISDHISEEAYEAGKKCLSDLGMYSSLLDVYKPGFWLNQIESMAMLSFKNLSQNGVDAQFLDMAAEDGKEIVSIETLDIQAQALVGYSDEYADYCLRQLPEDLENLEETAQSLGQLYDMWATGDMEGLDKLSNDTEGIPEDLLDDAEAYYDIMLYNRNEGMADKAAEFIENGKNYFFMVGVLHFAGDRGVTALLEDMGYTVERLY